MKNQKTKKEILELPYTVCRIVDGISWLAKSETCRFNKDGFIEVYEAEGKNHSTGEYSFVDTAHVLWNSRFITTIR